MKKIKNQKLKGYPESVGKFSIENYRVFEKETEFDFKPISFLVGPNSSGKSSLMKFLKSFSSKTINSWQHNFVPININSNGSDLGALSINLKDSRPVNENPIVFKIQSTGMFRPLGINYVLSYGNTTDTTNNFNLASFEIKRNEMLILSVKPIKNESYLLTSSIGEFISICKDFLKEYSGDLRLTFIKDIPNIGENDRIFNHNNHLENEIFESKLNDLEFTHFKKIISPIEIDTSKFPMEEKIYLQKQISFDEFGDNGLLGFLKFLILGVYQQLFENELEKLGFDEKIFQTEFGKFLLNDFSIKIQQDLTYTIGKNIDFAHTPVFKRERERVFNMNDSNLTTFDLLLKAYIADHLSYFENDTLLSDDYVDYWLIKFGIGKSLIIRKLESTEQYFIVEIEKDNGEKVNISDLGYGAGQVLAYLFLPWFSKIPSYHTNVSLILTEENIFKPIYHSGKRKVSFNDIRYANGKMLTQNVYLEEPETNLHPNWQSILAELIVFQISIGIRFVIETHSEYLIRKIQNLIALKECDKNDVVIYYFNSENERDNKNKPSSFKITLNDNGTLSESFGPGFFDEAGKLSLELLSINSIRKN